MITLARMPKAAFPIASDWVYALMPAFEVL
jgi:hypothetical protein